MSVSDQAFIKAFTKSKWSHDAGPAGRPPAAAQAAAPRITAEVDELPALAGDGEVGNPPSPSLTAIFADCAYVLPPLLQLPEDLPSPASREPQANVEPSRNYPRAAAVLESPHQPAESVQPMPVAVVHAEHQGIPRPHFLAKEDDSPSAKPPKERPFSWLSLAKNGEQEPAGSGGAAVATAASAASTVKPSPLLAITPIEISPASMRAGTGAAVDADQDNRPGDSESSADGMRHASDAVEAEPVAPRYLPGTRSAAPRARFQPAWEVDCFRLPQVCAQLMEIAGSELDETIVRLRHSCNDGRRVLLVASCRREQGRSSVAICLAKAAARGGLRVALLDADFDHPQLASRLGLNPTFGWQDAVATHLPLAEAAVASIQDRITLFPLRVGNVLSEGGPAEGIASVLDAVGAAFDLVIVDMEPVPPLAQAEETPPPPRCAAAILVSDGRTSREHLRQTSLQLASAGAEVVGVIENFALSH